MAWASYQIRKIAGCACAGNAGNGFARRRFQRKLLVSDPGMHHGTCVTHVPWCMPGSPTCGDGENVPGIPGACAPAILRIWQEANGVVREQTITRQVHDAIWHPSATVKKIYFSNNDYGSAFVNQHSEVKGEMRYLVWLLTELYRHINAIWVMMQFTWLSNPKMPLFHNPQCSIQIRNVHISLLNGPLWDMEQVHSGICEIGLLTSPTGLLSG